MFSIYGESGRLFKGAMEDLWHIEALRAITRTRRIAAHRDKPVFRVSEKPPAAAAAPHTLAGEAMTAYAQAAGTADARHPIKRVADVMSRDVITVEQGWPLLQAWQLLSREGLGQAPVTGMRGELVGLLTRAELLNPDRLPQPEESGQAWQALLQQPVSALMLSPVPAVSENTDIRRVARVLLDADLPGLPVVADDGEVRGFISRSDILRAVVHDPPLDLWS
jgi:CBS domain-containing protein